MKELTNREKTAIARLRASGTTSSHIAHAFGIKTSQVAAYVAWNTIRKSKSNRKTNKASK